MKNLNLAGNIWFYMTFSKMAFLGSLRLSKAVYLYLIVCLLMLAFGVPQPVVAQALPTLVFSPNPAVIDTRVASTSLIEIMISNAINIGGFDIQISYDPDVALINEWTQGDFFPDAICFAPVDIPGLLQVACTKIGTPGSSGSGTLVNLTFEANAWGGNTALTFANVELVEAEDAQFVNAAFENGELRVVPYHLALPLIFGHNGLQNLLPETKAETLVETKPIEMRIRQYLPMALPGCNGYHL